MSEQVKSINDFAENSDYNNRIIQMALREVETDVLTPALLAMDNARRDIIFRNMSGQAVEMIKADMAAAEGKIPHNAGRKGIATFEHHLNIFDRFMREQPDRASQAASEFPDVSFEDDPKEFLLRFSYFINMHPPMVLEEFLEKAPHPAVRKAMELMINGHSPEGIIGIIGDMREARRREFEWEYDLILATLENFAAGRHPRLLQDRLDVM